MTDRKPAEVFHPGEYIKDEMEERGWSKMDVMGKAHIELLPLRGLLEEVTPVTPDVAWQLERVFGSDAQTWLNLQEAYNKGQPGPCASCDGTGVETDEREKPCRT